MTITATLAANSHIAIRWLAERRPWHTICGVRFNRVGAVFVATDIPPGKMQMLQDHRHVTVSVSSPGWHTPHPAILAAVRAQEAADADQAARDIATADLAAAAAWEAEGGGTGEVQESTAPEPDLAAELDALLNSVPSETPKPKAKRGKGK